MSEEEQAAQRLLAAQMSGVEEEEIRLAMIPFIDSIAEDLATLRQENEQLKAVVQATAEEL